MESSGLLCKTIVPGNKKDAIGRYPGNRVYEKSDPNVVIGVHLPGLGGAPKMPAISESHIIVPVTLIWLLFF